MGSRDDRSISHQLPCTEDPTLWDLDQGTLTQWLAALRTCWMCPVLLQCGQLRDRYYPRGSAGRRVAGNPRSVIWAGVAYSEDGAPMDPDTLRRYASRRGQIQAPTGDEPVTKARQA